jgi:8-oxo-dGTP pyrophosphatase MutT (NUDIX family)
MHEVAKHESSRDEAPGQEEPRHEGPAPGESGKFGHAPDAQAEPVIKHGTATVLVFAHLPEGWRIGLIKHPLLGRMMMPGGHIEEEESTAQAALREVAEEAGLDVLLVSPPAAPLPAGYRPPRVAQPWWIVEYVVPPDNHLARGHVHVDHLYVAMADGRDHARTPEHPFGWYAAADLPGLTMFDDARLLATTLLAAVDGTPAITGRARAAGGLAPDGAAPGGASPGGAGRGGAGTGDAGPGGADTGNASGSGGAGPEGAQEPGAGDAEWLRAAILAALGGPGDGAGHVIR